MPIGLRGYNPRLGRGVARGAPAVSCENERAGQESMLSSFVAPGTASWRHCCGASWAFILLLAAAILIGASFHTLSPTEMGLDYDMWSCQVNDKVLFGNGRWFLGPGHSFITFPKATRSVLMLSRMPQRARTLDYRQGPRPAGLVLLLTRLGLALDRHRRLVDHQ